MKSNITQAGGGFLAIEPTLKDKVYAYLKEFHMGSKNAVSTWDLTYAFNVNSRRIREVVKELRRDLVPVCINGSGYFIATTEEEMEQTLSRIRSAADSLNETYVFLLSAINSNRGSDAV